MRGLTMFANVACSDANICTVVNSPVIVHILVGTCAHVLRSVLKRACSVVDNSSHSECVSACLC